MGPGDDAPRGRHVPTDIYGQCCDCSVERAVLRPRIREDEPFETRSADRAGRRGSQSITPLPELTPAERARLLRAITAVERRIFDLLQGQGLSMGQAAVAIGMSKGAVSKAWAKILRTTEAAKKSDGNRSGGEIECRKSRRMTSTQTNKVPLRIGSIDLGVSVDPTSFNRRHPGHVERELHPALTGEQAVVLAKLLDALQAEGVPATSPGDAMAWLLVELLNSYVQDTGSPPDLGNVPAAK